MGSLSYGLSIVLFVRAMRGLGAARTSALFGTAPLTGVALSFLLFRELPGGLFLAALLLIAAGTILLLNEQHEHVHRHEAIEHEHGHNHADEHHAHELLPDTHHRHPAEA